MLNSNATEFTGKYLVENSAESPSQNLASSSAVRDVLALNGSWFIKFYCLSFVAFVG